MGVPEDPPRSVVRFGDFELDLRSRELRKRGVRIALQERPLQVLEVLLRTPGELVTREALQHELWGGDTFVDFETGLNAAVRRLREALGDAAGVPRFVETLPRRGYRFIGPVHDPPQATHKPEVAAPVAAAEPLPTPPPPAPAPPPRSPWNPGTRYVVAVGVVIAIGGVMALSRWAGPRGALPAPPRIVPLTTTAGSEVTPTLSPDGTWGEMRSSSPRWTNWRACPECLRREECRSRSRGSCRVRSPIAGRSDCRAGTSCCSPVTRCRRGSTRHASTFCRSPTVGGRRYWRMPVSDGSFRRADGTGYLLFRRVASMYAVAFDPDRLELRGAPFPILEQVASSDGFGFASFDASRTGTWVYRIQDQATVNWLDTRARSRPLLTEPGGYEWLHLSHDGSRLAFVLGGDVWVHDIGRETRTRLAIDASVPLWTPDDRFIVFRHPEGLRGCGPTAEGRRC